MKMAAITAPRQIFEGMAYVSFADWRAHSTPNKPAFLIRSPRPAKKAAEVNPGYQSCCLCCSILENSRRCTSNYRFDDGHYSRGNSRYKKRPKCDPIGVIPVASPTAGEEIALRNSCLQNKGECDERSRHDRLRWREKGRRS